ncbi:cytosolic factor, phosphatidylinositol/phosphatidylcholine transfer protein [Nowakowskiella sp. JEL0407]|nr:cytosolic factor, phosphatidylinositol/phosphatidylcholine transfer protein [Nowakowskiella sp. JEL0407]
MPSKPEKPYLPGRLETLTDSQKEILDRFKAILHQLTEDSDHLSDSSLPATYTDIAQEVLANESFPNAPPFKFDNERHSDYMLLRFLRARKFDIGLSLKMFLEYEAWRATFGGVGVDQLVRTWEYPEMVVVAAHYPRFYHKTDKFGRPVYIEQMGIMNLDQIFAVSNLDRFLIQHVVEYEKLLNYRLVACSKAAGFHIEQSCTIIDMKGVTLSNFSRVFSFVQSVSTVAQNYYPEMLGRMYIINAPMLFTAVWQLVKPLLDEVTVNKISILGSAYTKSLLETIDEENLPKFLGGKSTDDKDVGPWNDGTLESEGYPMMEYEQLKDGFGLEVGPHARKH